MSPPPGPRRGRLLSGGVAPFGRLGRWLGFRWVFPIGTLAVPFHPLVARALLWLPAVLVAYDVTLTVAGRDGGVPPLGLVVAAAVLGLLLSVPVLQYAFFAFRFPVVQGALVCGAMVILALDVAAGRTATAWGVLPAAFATLYLLQRFGGPVALRRAERRNAAVTPVVPGHRGLEVTGWQAQDTARWLVEHCDLPRVSADGRSRLRVDPATYARVGEVSTRISTGFIREDGGVLVVHDLQPTAVRVHAHRHRGWWRIMGGDQTTWDVTDGELTQRLHSTKPSLVRGPPVFACFRFVAVFGGRSQWVIGFSRRTVPTPADGREGLAHAFPPLVDAPRTVVDAVEVLAPLEGALADAHRRYWALLDELAAAPDLSFRAGRGAPDLTALVRATEGLIAGSGQRLCDLVDRAKEEHGRRLAVVCAQALTRLPLEEYRSLTPRILTIVGSRILSLQWDITPDLDVRPLPRNLPRFGDQAGFGLLVQAPKLYERLGELDDPRVPRFVEALAAEAGWSHPLTRARDTYLSRHPR
jgi:hypothetical protein